MSVGFLFRFGFCTAQFNILICFADRKAVRFATNVVPSTAGGLRPSYTRLRPSYTRFRLSLWNPSHSINHHTNRSYSVQHNAGLSPINFRRYMHATCLGPFSGHYQACQYKNLTKEDITRCNLRAPCSVSFLTMLKCTVLTCRWDICRHIHVLDVDWYSSLVSSR